MSNQSETLSVEHCLRLELANERIARAQAEARAASAVAEIANLGMGNLRASIGREYGLGDGDHVNWTTGAITRKPKTEAPPAPPLELVQPQPAQG